MALDGVMVPDNDRAVMGEMWDTAVDLTRQLLLLDWSEIMSRLSAVCLVLTAIGWFASWLMETWWERHGG